METEQSSTSKKSSRFLLIPLLILLLLALIGVGVAIGVAITYFRHMQNNLSQIQTQVQQQQQILTATQTALQNLSQPQEKKLRALTQAAYLIQLANLHLEFEGNMAIANTALHAADKQLADLNDSSLMHLRQLLANDMAALQATPPVDLAGIILKINALSAQIPQLPIVPTELSKPLQAEETPAPTASTSLWREGLNAVAHSLKQMVIVRHMDQPAQPLLPPQQQAYLNLNIQLQLTQAEWALLHQQAAIYQQSLQQAIIWINQYFAQKSPLTQSVTQQLTELKNLSIKPAVPNLDNSLRAVEDAISTLGNKGSAS
jgi:uroporphyrin-3 C-methyltransferase